MSGRSVEASIRGESETVLRAKRAHTVAAGVHGAVLPLESQKAIREAIERGICPICGSGPFQSLGNHVPRTHGISAKELREIAGMKQLDSITSPEYRERNVRRGKNQFASREGSLRAGARAWRNAGGTTELTEPGRAARREQLDKVRPTGAGAYAHLDPAVRSERARHAASIRHGVKEQK